MSRGEQRNGHKERGAPHHEAKSNGAHHEAKGNGAGGKAATRKNRRGLIVVDAANVAYEEVSQKGAPKLANLVALISRLEELGFEPIVLADASLRHDIDDQPQFEALVEKQIVRQVPAGTDADYFIVQTAEQQDCFIVSNDRYQDYSADHPWIDHRRVPFMVVKGQVQLYEENLPHHE